MDCQNEKNPAAPSGFDLDRQPIPRFVRANYLDPGGMARISRFRSAVGGDYSDDFETCRSMLHYFVPRTDFAWTVLPLYAPVAGQVTDLIPDTAGTRITIQSQAYPDFVFHIFNAAPLPALAVGMNVSAGEIIGAHTLRNTPSALAVSVQTTRGRKLVSWFDVITDSLWHSYGACQIPHSRYFIISKEERDADPLTCSQGGFLKGGHLDNWTSMLCHWDVDAWGCPQFVNVNYIDLDRIHKISRFRSAIGHDFSDDFESCRSMKHYFWLNGDAGWESARLYAPVDGKIARRFDEFLGTQVWIRSHEYPDFEFRIFHIQLQDTTLAEGDAVMAGQLLGTHFSTRTYSDIAVFVETPRGRKLVSYFEVMSDALFQCYQARGLALRSDAIISRQQRDAAPLSCSGETFTAGMGALEDWVTLK